MRTVAEIAGYLGMAGILIGTYLLGKKNRVIASMLAFGLGEIGLVINCAYYGAVPAALVNGICAIINAINVWRTRK